MKIITQSGTVSTTSKLPTFNNVFPALIEPSKVVLHDLFETGVGSVLNNRSLDKGGVWTVLGGGNIPLTVKESGYISMNSTGIARAYTEHKTSGRVYAAIEFGSGMSTVGLFFRWAGQSDTFELTLSYTQKNVVLKKMVSGVTTALTGQAVNQVDLESGTTYHVGVEYTETGFKVYIDDTLIYDIEDSSLSNNTGVGLYIAGESNKVWEFAAG